VLEYETAMTPMASNVLAGYWSHDIGGFLGQQIDPELYVRWVEFGAFSPILRIHSDHGSRLPWDFPPADGQIAADFFRLRYALMPYIYTAARDFYDTGVALLRPMYYDYPQEEDAYRYTEQYMFGPSLLVAPVAVAADPACGLAPKAVWLPAGEWTDIFTGEVFTGPLKMVYATPMDRIPVFARAGAILTEYPPKQNTTEKSSRLILEVFPGAEGRARLYDDAGEGMAYQAGSCAWTDLHYRESASELELSIGATTGTFAGQGSERQVELRVHHCAAGSSVKVDGTAIPASAQEEDKAHKLLRIELPSSSIRQALDVQIGKDAVATSP
jgi:alpha-glucosidase